MMYMAVTTPFGLYEWLAMPMGLRSSPPIHQRRMTSALHELLGRICHIYLDDIVIWSNTVEQHTEHIRLVLGAFERQNYTVILRNAIFTSSKWISSDTIYPHAE